MKKTDCSLHLHNQTYSYTGKLANFRESNYTYVYRVFQNWSNPVFK